MFLCSKCGNGNADGVRFCTSCGFLLTPPEKAVSGAGKSDAFTGRIIEGKYRFDEKLGAGGMGTVYRGTRLLIGDQVAIKILNTSQHSTAQSLERFRREAIAAARLKHPNAVQIYDFGQTPDGLLYLIMELAEGESLRSVIKKRGALDLKTASEILGQICSALDEAHQQNIIHRDIKPDNIIVKMNASGIKVKVLDFGIARLNDLTGEMSLTQGGVIGTPHYMSPEQCLGEPLDRRSDIYSLGIVLFEMLSGTVPFEAPTLREIINKQITQAPPLLRTKTSAVTAAIESVVTMALEKDREARPQSAATLTKAFTNAIQQPATIVAPAAAAQTVKSDLPMPPMQPPQTPAAGYYPQPSVPVYQPVAPVSNYPIAPPAQKPKSKTTAFVITLLLGSLLLSGAFVTWVMTSRPIPPPDNGGNGSGNRVSTFSPSGSTAPPVIAAPTKPGQIPRLPGSVDKFPGGVQVATVGTGKLMMQIGALATSLLPPQNGVTFNAVNVLDNDPATLWAEGESDAGINQSLVFAFVQPVLLKGLRIAPGNFKSRSDWQANNRVAVVLIQLAENAQNKSDWKATLGTRLNDEMRLQSVKFDPIRVQYIRLVISEVYRGNSGNNQTMISQIAFDYE
jgi:serine/threonine-protein kinase